MGKKNLGVVMRKLVFVLGSCKMSRVLLLSLGSYELLCQKPSCARPNGDVLLLCSRRKEGVKVDY